MDKTKPVQASRGRIPFVRICCDGNELTYAKEVLESGWLTSAGKVQAFEQQFARAVQADHAIAVNSCTAALHLGLEAMGVGPGDKVFVPTMTFSASAMVVCHLGADPIFLDVEYGSNLLLPETLERAIECHPEAKALMVVHYGGQPARLIAPKATGLYDLCRKHGILVLDDAAHAFPASCRGRMIGSISEVSCFSFYANKTITTGEGGMLTTNSEALANRVKLMRLHGIDRDAWARYLSHNPAWEYDVVAPGFKYNMPDLNAAIGIAQLERAWQLREERQRCACHYIERLANLACIDLPKVHVPFRDHAWHLFPIIVKPNARINRNRVIELLARQGIGTSVHYKPLHRLTYFRDRYNLKAANFPEAERAWNGTVSLPIYPTLRPDELDVICDNLVDILG